MILPQEFIDRSVELLFNRSTVKSQILYSSTLIFFAMVLLTLPFAYIDIGRSIQGIVVSTTDRFTLVASRTGMIDEVFISENATVKKGELILSYQTDAIDQKIKQNLILQEQNNQFIQDLKLLIESVEDKVLAKELITSPLYRSEWFSYIQEQNELKHQLNNLHLKYTRTKTLYEKEIVSKAEFQQSEYEMESQRQRLSLQNVSWLNEWENALFNYDKQLEELKTLAVQFKEQRRAHFIYAPISGTFQSTKAITENSMIHANQVLSDISPDTTLIVELFVSPKDIGLIQEGMPVRFQIDAFNYNEWGHLEGKVIEIPNDAMISESGEIIFIVRCNLNESKLSLPNGYSASLKKGMTLQGRVILARRSIFQLLFDNVDDWLNPNHNQVVN